MAGQLRTFVPRDYQQEGIDLVLEHGRYYWQWPMSAGKTASGLLLADRLMFDLFACDRVLVIAPKRVADGVWTRDKNKWANLRHLKVRQITVPMRLVKGRNGMKHIAPADPKETRAMILAERNTVDVISRDHFPSLALAFGKRWPYRAVIWDEGDGINAHDSIRFRAMKAISPYIEYLVLLSGTPRPSSELELWAPMYLIDGGERLGRTLTAYRDEFFAPDKRGRDGTIYSWRCLDPGRIHALIADRCQPVDLTGKVQLPECDDVFWPVELPAAAMGQYRIMERDGVLDDNLFAGSAGALSGKLEQIASGAAYNNTEDVGRWRPIHTAKIEALAEIIELARGEAVIVLYWFKHELERLQRTFKQGVLFERDEQIEEFRAGKIPLMFLHPASAGHGIDGLQQGGHIFVWLTTTWSNKFYQQTKARLVRSDSRWDTVQNIHLVATGTIDEDKQAAIETKQLGQEAMARAIERIRARVKGENCGK